jgi:hypothetical protein
MMRFSRFALPALVGLFCGTGSLLAQYPGMPGQRPPVSPYINLGRPQLAPAIDYYGIVRPQLDFRQSLAGINRQVTTNELAIGSLAESRVLPPTGVAGNFNTQYRYFMTRGYYLNQTPTRPGGSFAPQAPGRGQLQAAPLR